MSLDRLRRCCIGYHVMHKYHQAADDIDNDLFLVMGRLRQDCLTPDEYAAAQNAIRGLLSSHQPLDVAIGVETLSIVAYKDRSLPASSSYVYPLRGVLDKFESLIDFYEQK